ncbi:phage tail tape measure protein [Helcococcus ovis]|uniref:phage tail tape measure protein n=1 Tax=Helcococcus ovis TaxID=72026 RepID=UPI0010703A1B|nr:phage tail tape measure protein [Helcococcus ovis]TFF68364.1 phage tail tape measure protein [Helcococcus ovis]WNZ00881.1 phage tail tape measure protein [Helcococcus ovis]
MTNVGTMQLPAISTDIIVNTSKIDEGMKTAATKIDKGAKTIKGHFDKVGDAGKNLSKVGGNLTKYVSVPLVGVGIGVGKLAIDFEKSFAKVSTLLDSSKTDFNAYKKDLLKGSTEAKVPVEEFSEAVYNSISAGVESGKAIKFTSDAMKLAKGGFTDGASAVDILTTAINGYKLKAEDANRVSDLLINTQNLGKTTVNELASSMGKVIPTASAANFEIEELSTSYAVLTKNGIATAESGTYLRSMLSELTKSGSETDKALRKLTKKGFADLKKEGKSTTEIFKMLDKYAKDNGKTLKDLFGSVEAGSAAMVLASGEGKEFNEILKSMDKSAGATNDAFKKMNSTRAAKMADMLNRIKNKAIELGEKLLPVFDKIVTKVEKAVDWFTSLDDSTQSMILKFGGLAIAAGPIIKTFGGLLSGISKVGTGMKLLGVGAKAATPLLGTIGTAASGASGALVGAGAGAGTLAGGLGSAALAAAPWVAGAAAIAGAGYLIYDSLQEKATPAVDKLADGMIKTGTKIQEINGEMVEVADYTAVKISESTKKQMESYYKLSDGAQKTTMEMFTGIVPMNKENLGKITSDVKEMSNQTVTAINTQKTETIKGFQEIFSQSTTFTANEKTQVLQDVEKMAEERKKKIEKMRDRLVELYEQIKKKGVSNSTEEKKEVEKLYQEMAKEQIRSVTKSKNEQEVLLNNLSSTRGQVTQKMVEDTIIKMNDMRDKSIQSAEEQYNKQIEFATKWKTDIELAHGKLSESQKRTYDKMVQNAEDNAAKTIKASELLRKEGIETLIKDHGELTKTVDFETGKQMNFWQKAKRNVNSSLNSVEKQIERLNATPLTDKYAKYHIESVTTEIHRSIRQMDDQTRYNAIHYGLTASDRARYGYHASGLDYVPYDGYKAHLHRGERVLTAKENKEYSSKGNGNININIENFANNTKEDVRSLLKRIGEEMKRQKIGRGQYA